MLALVRLVSTALRAEHAGKACRSETALEHAGYAGSCGLIGGKGCLLRSLAGTLRMRVMPKGEAGAAVLLRALHTSCGSFPVGAVSGRAIPAHLQRCHCPKLSGQ